MASWAARARAHNDGRVQVLSEWLGLDGESERELEREGAFGL